MSCLSKGNWYEDLAPPFRVEMQFWGKEYGDVAFFSDYLLISRRLADSIQSEEITGIDVLSTATVVKVKPRRMAIGIPEYIVARVRRSGAVLDHVASHVDYVQIWDCEECRVGTIARWQSVELVPGTWGGEDLFIARGLPGVIITSDRFRQFCLSHGFRNIKLIQASKYEVDWFPEKT